MKGTFKFFGIIVFLTVIGFTLAVCSNSSTTPTVDCTHIYGAWSQKTAATCTAAKVEKRICSICNNNEETRNVGAPLGHDWNAAVTVSTGVQAKPCKRAGCAERTDFTFSYNIGDPGPGGGIIFFVADGAGNLAGADGALGTGTAKTTPGFTFFQNASDSVGVTRYYLEVATTTIASQQWASANHLIPGLSQNSTDDTDWAIGRGMKNTEIIIAHGVATVPSYITQVATSARTGTDWFLPSKNELNELASRRNHANINITSGSFWSSSQYDSSTAWSQYFGSGGQDGGGKVGNDDVHAIRAF